MQQSVRSTTTAIALCRLGARGVRVLTPVEQVGYKRAFFCTDISRRIPLFRHYRPL